MSARRLRLVTPASCDARTLMDVIQETAALLWQPHGRPTAYTREDWTWARGIKDDRVRRRELWIMARAERLARQHLAGHMFAEITQYLGYLGPVIT